MSGQHPNQMLQQAQNQNVPQRSSIRFGYLTLKPQNQLSNRNLNSLINQISRSYIQQSLRRFGRGRRYNQFYPYNLFPLQFIQQNNLCHVSSTSQQTFKLSIATFKETLQKNNSHLFRQQMFWGINFPQLLCLDLSNCKLSNIQGITYCNLPVLRELQLQNNVINSIQVLNKCQFKFLQRISFYNNPLLEMNKLTRMKFQNLKIVEINSIHPQINFRNQLQIIRNSFEPLQIINFITKIEGIDKLKQFRLYFGRRIKYAKYEQIMKKINSHMKIYTTHQELLNQNPIMHEADLLVGLQFLQMIQQDEMRFEAQLMQHFRN